MNALLALSRAIDALNERVGRTVYWLVLVAVLISAANAVVRKAFNMSSNSFLEIQWYLFSAIFLFCAGYTLLRNQHVRIDVIAGRLSPQAQAWIDIFGTIFFLMPMALMIMWLSWPVFVQALERARGVDQRRRPDHLARAAAGAGRLLPARPPGRLRADQARRVPARGSFRTRRRSSTRRAPRKSWPRKSCAQGETAKMKAQFTHAVAEATA